MMSLTDCNTLPIHLQPPSSAFYQQDFWNLCDCKSTYTNNACEFTNYQIDEGGGVIYNVGPIKLDTRAFMASYGNEDFIGSGIPPNDDPSLGNTYLQGSRQ